MPHDDHLGPYDRRDRDDLWEMKAASEHELEAGSGTEKASRYRGKLTPEYRERYLARVRRCVERDSHSVTGAAGGADGDTATDTLAGYAFLLPEELSFVWDAAVLNEIYVQPADRGTGLADGLMEAALVVARE